LRRAFRWLRPKRKDSVHVVAMLSAYNEERFIAGCLEHLFEQGVEAYIIDNCSTDRTVEIAERYLHNGLIGIETLPRGELHKPQLLLERKEQLAMTLEADWFMHVDPDEVRLPPRSDRTLAQAFAEVEARGYNAVNFMEFTFVPTQEAPDHDHPHFQQTMRWYYPFLRRFPQRLNAWKRQRKKVKLVPSGGHRVQFRGLRMYPEPFKMRHYIFLSVPHALHKYSNRKHDPAIVQRYPGWGRMRASLTPEKIQLPSQKELRPYTSDDELDPSNPLMEHLWVLPQGEE
jgi:glycosyltransferase involved in cell wall biosynthesis